MKQLRKEGKRILQLFIGFLKNIILAPWTVAEAAARLNNSTKVWAYAIAPTIFFTLFIIMHFAELAVDGCWAIGKTSGSTYPDLQFPALLPNLQF